MQPLRTYSVFKFSARERRLAYEVELPTTPEQAFQRDPVERARGEIDAATRDTEATRVSILEARFRQFSALCAARQGTSGFNLEETVRAANVQLNALATLPTGAYPSFQITVGSGTPPTLHLNRNAAPSAGLDDNTRRELYRGLTPIEQANATTFMAGFSPDQQRAFADIVGSRPDRVQIIRDVLHTNVRPVVMRMVNAPAGTPVILADRAAITLALGTSRAAALGDVGREIGQRLRAMATATPRPPEATGPMPAYEPVIRAAFPGTEGNDMITRFNALPVDQRRSLGNIIVDLGPDNFRLISAQLEPLLRLNTTTLAAVKQVRERMRGTPPMTLDASIAMVPEASRMQIAQFFTQFNTPQMQGALDSFLASIERRGSEINAVTNPVTTPGARPSEGPRAPATIVAATNGDPGFTDRMQDFRNTVIPPEGNPQREVVIANLQMKGVDVSTSQLTTPPYTFREVEGDVNARRMNVLMGGLRWVVAMINQVKSAFRPAQTPPATPTQPAGPNAPGSPNAPGAPNAPGQPGSPERNNAVGTPEGAARTERCISILTDLHAATKIDQENGETWYRVTKNSVVTDFRYNAAQRLWEWKTDASADFIPVTSTPYGIVGNNNDASVRARNETNQLGRMLSGDAAALTEAENNFQKLSSGRRILLQLHGATTMRQANGDVWYRVNKGGLSTDFRYNIAQAKWEWKAPDVDAFTAIEQSSYYPTVGIIDSADLANRNAINALGGLLSGAAAPLELANANAERIERTIGILKSLHGAVENQQPNGEKWYRVTKGNQSADFRYNQAQQKWEWKDATETAADFVAANEQPYPIAGIDDLGELGNLNAMNALATIVSGTSSPARIEAERNYNCYKQGVSLLKIYHQAAEIPRPDGVTWQRVTKGTFTIDFCFNKVLNKWERKPSTETNFTAVVASNNEDPYPIGGVNDAGELGRRQSLNALCRQLSTLPTGTTPR